MSIRAAIASINRLPDRWVRLEQVRRVSGGFELSFDVHKGRRGKRIDAWRITCSGVHQASITDRDLGGLALYSSSHPAAREPVARQAEIRWTGATEEALLTGALYNAHTEAVDDWIQFDSHSRVQSIGKDKFACRGPEFLMRAYAKALRSIGKKPRLILRRRSGTAARPRVLHFGDSYVVANVFIAAKTATVL